MSAMTLARAVQSIDGVVGTAGAGWSGFRIVFGDAQFLCQLLLAFVAVLSLLSPFACAPVRGIGASGALLALLSSVALFDWRLLVASARELQLRLGLLDAQSRRQSPIAFVDLIVEVAEAVAVAVVCFVVVAEAGSVDADWSQAVGATRASQRCCWYTRVEGFECLRPRFSQAEEAPPSPGGIVMSHCMLAVVEAAVS